MVDEVQAHLKEMLEVAAIHPRQSPWCNTVVLVCKKDGGLCFCIDFCKLNNRTKKDPYPLPWIQEAIESLVGAGYFSCLDLKVGSWQIAMDEVSKQYIAFTLGNLGFFKCEHMPFGLCNNVAIFQRLIQNCLGELNLTYCSIYLDDVIVFSKMKEEHLQGLCTVFNHFREHNLRLKPTKCKFFQNEFNYLAHHISRVGVWPSKENLKAVAEFTLPQTYTEIQVFLGLLGHYQWLIKGFVCIIQPLHKDLSGEGASKKNKCVTLTEEALDAFRMLEKVFLEVPVLAFADFNKPFFLETDTSKLGLGAVLSQKQTNGWCHPVPYVSCSLTIHECNYHATKQECLAIKWTIAEQSQEYLLWKPFIVNADNNLLISWLHVI